MVPRDIAQDVAKLPADSPAYVGKLARWTRGQPGELEGLYASPIVPAAAAYCRASSAASPAATRSTACTSTTRAIRTPGSITAAPRLPSSAPRSVRGSPKGCGGRWTRARRSTSSRYPDALPGRLAGVPRRADDGTDAPAARRRQSRAARRAGHASPPNRICAKPTTIVCRTGAPGSSDGIVDVVCPMAYTPEAARFARSDRRGPRRPANGRPIWAGIGAYRLTPAQTVDNIQTARRLGAAGVILFSYDSLTDPKLAAPDTSRRSRERHFAGRLPVGHALTADPARVSRRPRPHANAASLLRRHRAPARAASARGPSPPPPSRSAAAPACCGDARFGALSYDEAAAPHDRGHHLRSGLAHEGHRHDIAGDARRGRAAAQLEDALPSGCRRGPARTARR